MPHRQQLLNLIADYHPTDHWETRCRDSLQLLVENNADCFDRTRSAGHITGSAWLVNPAKNKVILLHHKKLDVWLQPGGHADGDADVQAVALKEAHEETGLPQEAFKLMSPDIFDVDMHIFPAMKGQEAHIHYDIRFLFEVDDTLPLPGNSESHAVKWFSLEEAAEKSVADSAKQRMLAKTLKMVKLRAD